MTHLLEKNTSFIFSDECIQAFQTLKKKLTEAPILIAPDWDLPFELMCDASDFAIGAVLGQRHEKHFRPIHYASKTMNEAESHYTTTEKEMLAVVYAFEKFRSYLILNKSIVYTDHSALKYLFAKKDSKGELLGGFSPSGVQFKSIGIKGAGEFVAIIFPDYLAVFFAKKLLTSSQLATVDPPGDITVPTTPPKRFLTQDFIGPRFTKMPMTWSPDVTLVSVKEKFRSMMKCLKIPYKTVGENRASWSDKLDDALWTFHTTYKTPIRCTPYKLVYGKACHLPIELEHKAYWALKHANFDLETAGDHRKVQINELNELRDHAYENSLNYKEKTKRIHDSKIKNRVFNVGDQVLLFNSRLKMFSSKLKSRWSGPFTIAHVFPYGTVELS
ncbi:reverse transcriptase domain-containing protein [Tanacetum coccineum]